MITLTMILTLSNILNEGINKEVKIISLCLCVA